MVRASIGPVGLVEAKAGGKARFEVSFSYGATKDREWVTRYADPYFPGGYGPGWGYYGGWKRWGGGAFFAPPGVNGPGRLLNNGQTDWITDNDEQGATVNRSSAVNQTTGQHHHEEMPK